ncbi:MAG: hypothetical protein M1821_009152 [Bathelium mastoideum]|nr:MAG: hypothetical protein M1821_009152 [Bathelium mastoideum]
MYSSSYRTIFITALILVLSVSLIEVYYLQSRPKQDKGLGDGAASTLSQLLSHKPDEEWAFDPKRDRRNRALSDAQCDAAFPDQYQEIDRALRWHKKNKPSGLVESDINPWHEGDHTRPQLRIMIYKGHLRILSFEATEAGHVPDRPIASVAAIYRAISALPDPALIPNVEFTIDVADNSMGGSDNRTIWGYCRHHDDEAQWVMPEFNDWSHPAVGSYDEFLAKVQSSEEKGGFMAKQNKLFWRGSPLGHDPRRAALIKASEGQDWNDVSFEGLVPMHDHCRYRFLAHTEGLTWSGRLRYLLNCNSAIIAHKFDWIAHWYPLLQASGPNQNFIQVEQDHSDLKARMDYYTTHTDEAEKLAEESVRVFRDRYLTPAAEVCYWRRMFRSWRDLMSWEPRICEEGGSQDEGKCIWRGLSWEQYVMTGRKWGCKGQECYQN